MNSYPFLNVFVWVNIVNRLMQPKEISKCLMQFFWYCPVTISQCYNFSRHLCLVGKTLQKKALKERRLSLIYYKTLCSIMKMYTGINSRNHNLPYAPALSPSDHHLFLSLRNHHEGRVLETHKKLVATKE